MAVKRSARAAVSRLVLALVCGLAGAAAPTLAVSASAAPDDGSAASQTRTVRTATALVRLLDSSYQGVIFIPGDTRINMAGHQNVVINSGVTLRSDRGGTRLGGLIYTNDFDRRYDLFVVEGSNVRIEGLRIRGPSTSEDESHTVVGIRVRAAYPAGTPLGVSRQVLIRGNELSAWPGAAVAVSGAIDYADCFDDLPVADQTIRPWHAIAKTQASQIAIVGNYIHHNLRHNHGYGVVVGDGAYATVQANIFEYNRHAIASSGSPYSGYSARYNYNLESTNFQNVAPLIGSWPTHYDMHGCEGGDGGDGGEWVEVAYNTIRGDQDIAVGLGVRKAFRIRGTPRDSAWFVENVLVHDDFGDAIDYYGSGERVFVEGNSFDVDHSLELGVADFDNDGRDDVFHATGIGWYYSSGGVAPWQFLTRSALTLSEVGFGDFDGDGFTDVFDRNKGDWRYFSGRERRFKSDLGSSGVVLSALRFGDFDGNGRTDVFWADGTNWRVKWNGRGEWDSVNSSVYRSRHLRLCDFDGDGRSDVFNVRNGEWSWSRSASTRWSRLNDDLASVDNVVLGDFDGDARCDVAYESGDLWRFARGGRGRTIRLRDKDADWNRSIKRGVVGRFVAGRRDVFLRFPELKLPLLPVITGLNFVRWHYASPNGDSFVAHSRQNMR
jgi:type II secretory pathway pseudopilin PulG